MKHNTLIAIAVAAILPLGAGAIAGDKDKMKDHGAMTSKDFTKLDTNRDGRISQSEAAMDSSIVWSQADSNGDGYLDSSEWSTRAGGANGSGNRSPQSSSPDSPPSDPNQPQVQQPGGTPRQ